MAENIRVVLPKKYDLVVGDTFQLFYRGVIEAPNPYIYSIFSQCERGKSFPRYFEYTPTEPGVHKLTIRVVDADMRLVGQGETELNVVVPKAPEKPLNILCIGDSLTHKTAWAGEVYRRITARDGMPEGLGFENAVRFLGKVKYGEIYTEAYGGWNWNTFQSSRLGAMWVACPNTLSAENQHSIWKDENGALWQLETLQPDALKFNRYQNHSSPMPKQGPLVHESNAVDTQPIHFDQVWADGYSPLFNPQVNDLDFTNYAQQLGVDTIDVVYVLLGINGLYNKPAMDVTWAEYCQGIVASAKQLVGKLKEAFPQVKVKIMGLPGHSVNGGMGANYGTMLPYADSYDITHFEKELDIAYEQWCLEDGWKDFMEFINLSGQFDCENSFPYKPKPVNTRSAKLEDVGTNGVHPSLEGYLQIADAVYRNLVASFFRE